MIRLFDVMLTVARETALTVEGKATGGGSTTLVDSLLGTYPFTSANDVFKNGTLFITRDAEGQGAAPEAQTARITGYTASTGTLTFPSGSFSANPASGDLYAVTVIPRYVLIQAVNTSLTELGLLPFTDTTLTTQAGQRSYTLPTIAQRDLRQVWIAEQESSPYTWIELHHWRQIRGGDSSTLEFTSVPPANRKLRLVCCSYHPVLWSDSDTVLPSVPLGFLNWRSIYHVCRYLLNREGYDERKYMALMNEAAEYAQRERERNPVALPFYTARYFLSEEPNLAMGVSDDIEP